VGGKRCRLAFPQALHDANAIRALEMAARFYSFALYRSAFRGASTMRSAARLWLSAWATCRLRDTKPPAFDATLNRQQLKEVRWLAGA
jgi:hypothetical protein